ncbi:hypothetical protein TWF481_008002 [Arthrobotrys musiformis]|uniref:A to I editase domain-containing protein n=1 Tax=Arthrobotrys musiformis TaxID=47236 RepID=A0AAV9W6T9_9PEZI
MSLEDRIATLALQTFSSLPPKCKPRSQEWIPLSAIVLQTFDNNNDNGVCNLHLASLATGSKCIPTTTLPKSTGLILHDSHSEILALRALNHFLLQDARRILTDPEYTSPYLIYNNNNTNNPPFTINQSLKIHLFSTEPPCGDASMEFIISAQEDPTPWSPPFPPTNPQNTLPGRSYFSTLSIVRRKPSRPDAPPTLSKSCTDKITLKQFTSILSSPSSLIISPKNAYITTFTVPYNKYNPHGYARAFTPEGRLSKIPIHNSKDEEDEYKFSQITPTPLPPSFPFEHKYPFSKPPPQETSIKASNLSAVYINHLTPITEVLISGVKQGNAQLSPGDRKGSVVCRKKAWMLLRQVTDLLPEQYNDLKDKVESCGSYRELKDIDLYQTQRRREMKRLVTDALNGWERNIGDDDWGI